MKQQQDTFNALVCYPESAYFKVNKALEGIATFDSTTREESEEQYTANVEVPTTEIQTLIDALGEVEGKIVEIVSNKQQHTTSAVRKYGYRKSAKATATSKAKSNGKGRYSHRKSTELDKLKAKMTEWRTVAELSKLTGKSASAIHGRFHKMNEAGILEKKAGSGKGSPGVYRVSTAA